jgi:hypothetical protein
MLQPEPLTSPDLVRDLLEYAREHEWVHHYERCPRGCCGDWKTSCPSCDAEEGDYKSEDYQKHALDCKLAALIRRAEAFIAIEDQLAEERERQQEASDAASA